LIATVHESPRIPLLDVPTNVSWGRIAANTGLSGEDDGVLARLDPGIAAGRHDRVRERVHDVPGGEAGLLGQDEERLRIERVDVGRSTQKAQRRGRTD
jgi:hypothetical protein